MDWIVRYKVRFLQDNYYEVIELQHDEIDGWTANFPRPGRISERNEIEERWITVFQGTLPECKAWIDLVERNLIIK